MAISVDYSVTPWLITIPKSDLTLITGTKYELSVDAFWQLLRDYADSEEGVVNPVIYTRIAATASTPSITEVNDGYYALQFEDGLYSVNIINGNTNIRDVEVKNQVSIATNNTTGFIDPKFLEFGTFESEVWIDQAAGSSGTDYPIGTPKFPVNNWADAIAIANEQGLYQYHARGTIVIDSTAALSNARINGEGPTRSVLVVQDAANVSSLQVMECFITGVMDGDVTYERCVVRDVSFLNGIMLNCIFNPSAVSDTTPTITLSGGVPASFFDCSAGLPTATGGTPIIDMGGSGQALALREWNGHVTITNKTGADNVVVELDAGVVKLDSTVTNGEIVVRGVGRLINESSGTTVVVEELLDPKNLNKTLYTNGFVYLDTASGITGTLIPKGTEAQAVDNYADAKTILDREGLGQIKVSGTLVFGAGDTVAGLTLEGKSNPKGTTLVFGGNDTTLARIKNATVTGAMSGRVIIENSITSTLTNFTGGLVESFIAGDITLDATFNDVISLGSCAGVTITSTPVLDLNGAPCGLAIQEYFGGLELRGIVWGQNIDISISGFLEIDLTTVTAATISVYGTGRVIDAATGDEMPTGTYGSVVINNYLNSPQAARDTLLGTEAYP